MGNEEILKERESLSGMLDKVMKQCSNATAPSSQQIPHGAQGATATYSAPPSSQVVSVDEEQKARAMAMDDVARKLAARLEAQSSVGQKQNAVGSGPFSGSEVKNTIDSQPAQAEWSLWAARWTQSSSAPPTGENCQGEQTIVYGRAPAGLGDSSSRSSSAMSGVRRCDTSSTVPSTRTAGVAAQELVSVNGYKAMTISQQVAASGGLQGRGNDSQLSVRSSTEGAQSSLAIQRGGASSSSVEVRVSADVLGFSKMFGEQREQPQVLEDDASRTIFRAHSRDARHIAKTLADERNDVRKALSKKADVSDVRLLGDELTRQKAELSIGGRLWRGRCIRPAGPQVPPQPEGVPAPLPLQPSKFAVEHRLLVRG